MGILSYAINFTSFEQNQLSGARQEVESKTKEMAVLRQTITHKEGEVKGLSIQLQTQEALLQRLLTQPPQAMKPDPRRELEVEEELQRLTEEVTELRARLVEAEGGRQEAQRQMETAQLESRLLREFTNELRAARQPLKPKPAVSQPPTVKPKPAVRKRVSAYEVSSIPTRMSHHSLAGQTHTPFCVYESGPRN